MQHVGADRARDAERIDAVVRIEAPVLDREEGLAAGTPAVRAAAPREPPISPRVASTRPLRPTIWIEGGRFGTSSDWIGGRCAATQAITPIAPMKPTGRAPATNRPCGRSASGAGLLRFFLARRAGPCCARCGLAALLHSYARAMPVPARLPIRGGCPLQVTLRGAI